MRARTPILATALALLLTACGNGDSIDGPEVEVRPFSEVQASDLTFEADPSVPDRGIFRVTTSEPMICAIVWGETEDLGRFNNSLAMSGTGITQHDVALPNAIPGRTYYFVVQGSTADGTLYSSEMATFTIPVDTAPTTTEPGAAGTNLALEGSIVEVSSEFGSSWVAENAIDDDLGTEWSTGGDGDGGFITIDLGATATITGVEFLTRSMADGSATTSTYRVIVDGSREFGPFDAGTPANPVVGELSAEGREVRFEIESSTGGNTGAIEVRIYGTTG